MTEAVSNQMPADILSIHHLSLNFGKREVLRDINVTIKAGEFIGLIGPNGAGKSTLLKVILNLQNASSGKVEVLKQAFHKKEQLIGYVPQKLFLEPQVPLRARDLVALGFDGHRWGISLHNKEKRRQVDKVLEAVDALGFANAAVGTLSGGEQQRLLIAQAILSNLKLLLLDEPLSNLDIKSAYEVVKLISKISKERKMAVILVAHDMNPLLDAMDRVLYLAEGNGMIGTVDQVFQSEILSQLYGYNVEVLRVNGRLLVVGNDALDVKDSAFEKEVIR